MDNQIGTNDYEQYLRELIAIYQESKDNDSIVMEFYFDDTDCKTAVKRITEDGVHELLKVKNFSLIKGKELVFLADIVTSYILYNEIFPPKIFSDSNNSTKNTVKILTKKNDKFNINGLEVEIANKLIDEIKKTNEEKNNKY